MGLFESLGVSSDELPETGFTNPKDGFYNFEITEVSIRQGTAKDPNCTKLTIEYDLDEAGKTLEWFHLADDGEVTEKARKSLSFLADRLKSLGEDPDTFDPDDETLIGLTGSLKLETRNGFQNVRNVEVDNDVREEVSDDPSDYDDGSQKQDAAIKRRVAANRAKREEEAPATKRAPAKPAARKPAPKKDVDEDEDNPFENED